jgi:hypothetical protein
MTHLSVTKMTCASCSVQSGVGVLQMSRASCSRQPRPHLKVPLLQLTCRTAPQQFGASVAAVVLDAASTRPSFSVPRLGGSLRSKTRSAVMSASSADSSASKPTATRKQLDQFFDILSSDKQIMTAQCWSFADYERFEDRILRRGVLAFWPFKKTTGCCYFAVSAPSSTTAESVLQPMHTWCFDDSIRMQLASTGLTACNCGAEVPV